jgi:hypothetical protein
MIPLQFTVSLVDSLIFRVSKSLSNTQFLFLSQRIGHVAFVGPAIYHLGPFPAAEVIKGSQDVLNLGHLANVTMPGGCLVGLYEPGWDIPIAV